ncbi:MAG: S8 family serine peptidase [Thermoanaerobaculales bacterium]|jgi:subtilisin family serine protease|nr:S8 family serine peptidase [Thermoanaerobaculales bacterium]
MLRLTRPLLLALAAALASPFVAVGSTPPEQWRSKVDPWVLETGRERATEFLVFLDEQAELAAAADLESKGARGAFVHRTLTETATRTQAPILAELDALGVEHRSYWVANMIWVRGGIDVVQRMAERPDVDHVYANPAVTIDLLPDPVPGDADAPRGVEWGIGLVNADDVWAAGVTGSGVVVAGQDTGYFWQHPALVQQYRGGPGNHDYHWHDAIHSGGGSCGPDSQEPCDDHGHGTHTMGTIVGDDGAGNQVGMAPTARWIGCRNMDQGTGTPATYAECYQFFIAPTDLDGLNPDPSMAPDVINNSWGCPPDEGCTDPNALLTVVQNVRAAGIVTVHSAGNEGSGCSSVTTPSAIYAESFSVGATGSGDDIAYFSSRGPVTVDGSNRMKPDISAPGVNIRSSTRDGGYGTKDGTSMAGPHVAGLVALVISASPGLAGDVGTVEEIIEQTAVPLTTSQGCGGDGPTEVPNNVYGWGRIDALAAFNYALDFRVVVDVEPVRVCAPAPGVFNVTVEQYQGFDEPVALTAPELPLGALSSFDPNPVTPPGSSQLTVGGTGAPAPGSYPFDIVGTSIPSAIVQQAPAMLEIFDAAPAAAVASSPANGAAGVSLVPLLEWAPAPQTAVATVQIAADPAFTDIVTTAETEASSWAVETPLAPLTTYYWRVRTANPCGIGAWSATSAFTTRDIPPILLVDDDDNSPDVRSTYTAGLDALGLQYDVWDTGNSDTEPSLVELAPYETVIWFTGDEFGGSAGPGPAGEAALAAWLDTPVSCLFLSAQDYYYDRGLTPFMTDQLGLAAADSDTSQTTVTGDGGIFSGLGPYTLSYPVSNYSDTLTATAAGEITFTGNQGGAGVGLRSDTGLAVFLGFPWEALSTDTAREEVLSAFLDACTEAANMLFTDGFESGDMGDWTDASP